MSRKKWIAVGVAGVVVIGIIVYSQSTPGSKKVQYPTWRPTVGTGRTWAPYQGGSGRPGATKIGRLAPSRTLGPGTQLLAGGCGAGGGCCHACSIHS